LLGGRFLHAKPNLCPRCAHREPCKGWEGYCTERERILSAPKDENAKGRCPQFKPTAWVCPVITEGGLTMKSELPPETPIVSQADADARHRISARYRSIFSGEVISVTFGRGNTEFDGNMHTDFLDLWGQHPEEQYITIRIR
jgi:hypothetical protein